jgi:cyclase
LPDKSTVPQKLTKDVYAVISNEDSFNEGFGSNQGFVVLENSVLVYDTGFSDYSARKLDRALASITDKKVRYIVNSHDHSDHIFGNSYFYNKYSRFGLNIISHEICAREFKRLGPQRLEEYKKSYKNARLLSSVKIIPPEITYSDIGMNLKLEGTEFVLFHPENGAHTLGDTVLAIPGKGVMFLGDIFLNSYFPNLEDANIEEWVDSLNDLDFNTYSKFLPGHGKPGGKREVVEFSNYMSTLRDRLLQVGSKPDRLRLRSFLETEGTEDWKSRYSVELSIDSLLGKTSG